MKPKDISEKLPKLISLIRIIWVNSPHYNTRERLTALFRKVGAAAPCWQGSDSLADVRWKGHSGPAFQILEMGLRHLQQGAGLREKVAASQEGQQG